MDVGAMGLDGAHAQEQLLGDLVAGNSSSADLKQSFTVR
jgi:hypothetical protein